MGFPSYQSLLFFLLLVGYSSHEIPALLADSLPSSSQPSSYSCPEHEASALLQFRHTFFINCAASVSPNAYPKVKSWGGEPHHQDCCSWDGVSCDNETGHVIGLELSSSCLYGTFPSNTSLFKLTHLRHLSLSDNHFNRSQIPVEVGQFTKLVSLDLSDSAFHGQIPLAISRLSMLSVLDLSTENVPKAQSNLRLEDDGLERLIQNLTRLNHLNLDIVDISSPVPVSLSNLTLLEFVSLQFCNLYGQFPNSIFHLPHLQILYLTGNNDIVGFLPEFRHNNSPLRKLSLSVTSFHGELPSSIGELANLELLYLFSCDFTGTIPSSLGNLTKLTSLNLGGWNNFSGDVPSSLTNITKLHELGLSHLNGRPERLISWLSNLNKLTSLTLNYMNLGGEIPSVIANFTSLIRLDLLGNELTGGFPHWLMNITELNILNLVGNHLKGPISSQAISQLVKLDTLWLNNNLDLQGNLDGILKLINLRDLNLGGVKLTFSSTSALNGSVPKLNFLVLYSCNLTEFPQFLRGQDQLQQLDLRNNHIHGSIPQWFVNITQESLYLLDLSNNFLTGFEQSVMVRQWSNLEKLSIQGNRLQGTVPIPPSSIVVYQVSSNQLVGGIPNEICQASSLNYLDISNNSLSGQIPNCISELSSSLFVLNLAGNKFNGTIPSTYPESCQLKIINLSGNQLEGSLPKSLASCVNLEVLDIGRNKVNDTFPSWLGGLPRLHVLVLRHNNFHGSIGKPKVGLHFESLHIIDLSNNFHTGDLPSVYLQNWDAMKLANESQSMKLGTVVQIYIRTPNIVTMQIVGYDYSIIITNKGNDVQYQKILTAFRVIDFSSNMFIGRISYSIGELKGLQAINLSNNNLAGSIPSSLANIRDLESLDLSNNMLSGEIPLELTQLTFLEVFNVSSNHLKGPIPQERQFSTFDNSSFVGNLGLCGPPLSKKCGDAPTPASVSQDEEKEEDDDSKLIDWIVIGSGCLGGFAVGCALGKYITYRNHEWFMKTFEKRGGTPRTRGKRAPPITRRGS